jgi:ABC-type glycerol-3-phosphate transport system substrate-binding protein
MRPDYRRCRGTGRRRRPGAVGMREHRHRVEYSSAPSAFKQAAQDDSAPITVWADSTRLPDVQKYQKEHPNVKMNIVTYDGSADGSTYLQTKVQLFDRTGSGWPDVVFASPTDVTWASQPTSPSAQAFAAPVDQLVPASTLQGFATGSLSPCQVDGHTYCLRNDIAQVVLWYNKKLMDQWGYQVPTTWEQYQALGEEVAKQHPGYVIGAVGDTNSQESYFWSSQCPAQQLVAKNTLKVDLSAPRLHPDGEPARPADRRQVRQHPGLLHPGLRRQQGPDGGRALLVRPVPVQLGVQDPLG